MIYTEMVIDYYFKIFLFSPVIKQLHVVVSVRAAVTN